MCLETADLSNQELFVQRGETSSSDTNLSYFLGGYASPERTNVLSE